MNNNDIISKIKEEFKRHTTALMEHMTKEVKSVAEGHGILAKKIDRVEAGLEVLVKDVKEIKSELHSVKMAVMTVNHEVGSHEKRIKKIEEKVFT